MGNNKVQVARKSREERLLARQTTSITAAVTKKESKKDKAVVETSNSRSPDDAELLMSIAKPRIISEDAAKDKWVDDWVSSEIARFNKQKEARGM